MIKISVIQVLHEIQYRQENPLEGQEKADITLGIHWTGYAPVKDGFILEHNPESKSMMDGTCMSVESFPFDVEEEDAIPTIEAFIERAKDAWESLPDFKKRLRF